MFTMLYKAFLCSKVKQICCFLSRKHFWSLIHFAEDRVFFGTLCGTCRSLG